MFPIHEEVASTYAEKTDPIFIVITLLAFLFTAIVFTALGYLTIKYRRGNRVDRSRPIHTDLRLELGWSLGPMVLAIGIFVWSAIPFASVFVPPKDAEEILVIGKRWMWHVQNATTGIRENNELHVPIGKNFKLTMISQDVIHDFYIPAFRLKRDVIPGRYTTVWFNATKPGRYHLFCAEYCGNQHSQMGGWVTVMKPAEYQAWLKTGGVRTESPLQTPEQVGADLFQRQNCVSCHAAATNIHGPSLVGIYGTKRRMLNGSIQTADETYLRGAILEPEKYPLEGYPNILMPSYKGNLTEEQIFSLIAYIKSLTPNHGVSLTETSGTQANGTQSPRNASAGPASRPKEASTGGAAVAPGNSTGAGATNAPRATNVNTNTGAGTSSGPATNPNATNSGLPTTPSPEAVPNGENQR